MSRALKIVALAMAVGCTPGGDIPTLQGEPVERGGDPSSVVETIDLPDLPTVLLSSEKGEVSLGVYQVETGKPYVTLRDANGDGVFDLLTYFSLSKTGVVRVEVEDFGMDGQPDLIINHAEEVASVFYRGLWHDVKGIDTGTPATIEVEGELLLLDEVLHERGREAF